MSNKKKNNSVDDAQVDSVAVADWRNASTRNERGRLIREALFQAAAEVVGERGYQDASITLITQRAGVAQGTFYNHFESRQDILDKLLPTLGKDMLDYVRTCSREGTTLVEREELGFKGFFSFLKKNPHFFRILNEAESFAPKGHREHLDLVASGYVRMLSRARDNGELPGYDERELEAISFMLMAARSYLGWRYVYGEEKQSDVPDWVVQLYSKFISTGFSNKPI
ncbi:TetR/AcrR family transcriptional regulator [Alcaligenaceae bacterium]|nr:TetR/AcrR family transcriptional regulator [Alcaligenaceae bacterium]